MQTASWPQASVDDNRKQMVLVVWGWGDSVTNLGLVLVESPEDRQVPTSHENCQSLVIKVTELFTSLEEMDHKGHKTREGEGKCKRTHLIILWSTQLLLNT